MLSLVLLIGVFLSSRLVSHAISVKSNLSNNKSVFSKYEDISDVKDCKRIYRYVILKEDPDEAYMRYALRLGEDYGADKGKKYPVNIKYFSFKFENGYKFKNIY